MLASIALIRVVSSDNLESCFLRRINAIIAEYCRHFARPSHHHAQAPKVAQNVANAFSRRFPGQPAHLPTNGPANRNNSLISAFLCPGWVNTLVNPENGSNAILCVFWAIPAQLGIVAWIRLARLEHQTNGPDRPKQNITT